MDIKCEIDIKDEPTEGVEYSEAGDQMYVMTGLQEIRDRSCEPGIDIKIEIKIEEEPLEIKIEDLKNEESFTQKSVVEKRQDLYIEEKHKENGDIFKGNFFSENRFQELEEITIEKHDTEELCCSNCNFLFESADDLMSHLKSSCERKIAGSQYGCDINCESDLKTCLLNKKNGDKSNEKGKLFKGSECSYDCNKKRCLKQHILKHQNTKVFKCSHCNYECSSTESLKSHLLAHRNVKLFKCSDCNYECNFKGNLQNHILTHENIKLFKCSERNYECNRKGILKTKRSKNFSQKEIDLLLNLVTEQRGIIENKKTDGASVNEKEMTWKNLGDKFNEVSNYLVRDWKTLKGKYENLKKMSKKKFAEEKGYLFGTGDGPSHTIFVSDMDLKIKDLGDIQIVGQCDSDSLVAPTQDLMQRTVTEEIGNVKLTENTESSVMHNFPEGSTKESSCSNVSCTTACSSDMGFYSSQLTQPMDELESNIASVSTDENNQLSTAFSIKDLRKRKASPPKIKEKYVKQISFDDIRVAKKIENVGKEKEEVLKLQKRALEEQIKYQTEEHELRMKIMQEEHTAKMKLYELKIKNQEQELVIKRMK